jgi:hypothetical protein
MVAKRRGVNERRLLTLNQKIYRAHHLSRGWYRAAGSRRTHARHELYKRAAFHEARHQQLFLR